MKPTKRTAGNAATAKHKWAFKLHLKRHVFHWRSTPQAIARIKQALAEIKKVAKTDPTVAAIGAIEFIEWVPCAEKTKRPWINITSICLDILSIKT